MKIEQINKEVIFDEKSHTYIKSGKNLKSATSLLSLYKNKFDPDGHIIRACAKRDGITVNEVKNNWHKIKEEGLARGQNFHRQAEYYIKNGIILNEDYKDVVEQLVRYPFKGKLFSEIALHSDKYGIAGTCDLIELFDDNSFITYDFKTNKRFTIKSKYKTKLLYPLEEYDECDLITYSLQLNIYNIMLEEFGFKSKDKSVIFYINPETRKIDEYEVLSLKKQTLKLLKHFKSMQDW